LLTEKHWKNQKSVQSRTRETHITKNLNKLRFCFSFRKNFYVENK